MAKRVEELSRLGVPLSTAQSASADTRQHGPPWPFLIPRCPRNIPLANLLHPDPWWIGCHGPLFVSMKSLVLSENFFVKIRQD